MQVVVIETLFHLQNQLSNFFPNIKKFFPELLFRYPREDHPSLALPTQLPMFCLPLGATVERWCANSRHPLPVFSTFVLTDQVGQKCYGASVVFYKDFDSEFLTKEQEEFFNEEPGLNGVQVHKSSENESSIKEKYVYQQNQV